MRILVVACCWFLIGTGFALTWPEWLPMEEEDLFISLLHIWVGFFFIVIFPMYAIDHINGHRKRLRRFSWTLFSGLLQLIGGLGLIGSGIVLLLWGDELALPVLLHFGLTFVLVLGILAHHWIPKNR